MSYTVFKGLAPAAGGLNLWKGTLTNMETPQTYMTVGQIAKKMDITVRTMQYYDREGLLCPSAQSEGGRRLYTYKDLIKLHQILSLKHLGFSLDDIKSKIINLDAPAHVAEALSEQAEDIKQKIASLSESLREIELLKAEVLQIKSVDFKKYADIVVNLQMKNRHYWLIKHFDDSTLDHIRRRFDKESGMAFMERFTSLGEEAIQLDKSGISPASEGGQDLARRYWNMIEDFTQGDLSLIGKLMEIGKLDDSDNSDSDGWAQKQAMVNAYIEKALDVYFTNLGVDPLREDSK